jgi:hypothetical protein
VSFGLGLKHGDKVLVQFHLAEADHPMKYAIKSTPIDPASRLAISLSIPGYSDDENFHVWLVSRGEKTVKKTKYSRGHLRGIQSGREGVV